MTMQSGALSVFGAIGNREDLSDIIYNISPTDTPFMASIGKSKATAVFHEWQTDSLAAAAANAQLEGDVYTFSTPSATTRLSNSTQISYKTLAVTETQDAVNKAGRMKEYAYQLVKRTKELRRDMEFVLTGNQAPVAMSRADGTGGSANTTTARVLRPLCGWYSTNDVRGSGGADGTSSAAATDASAANQRELTEDLLKTGIRLATNQGGEIDTIMVGTFNKQVISTFTGNVTKMQNVGGEGKVTLVSNIDFYRSDFGVHKIVFNRFQRSRDVHGLDTEYWALATLRPIKVDDLGKVSDATLGAVKTEYTLESRNEAASFVVADTNPTGA